MAVAISPSDCSNPYPFGVANSWETLSSGPLSMVGVMSYHYPPLHSDDNEMGIPPPPSFIPSYTIPSQQLSSLPTVDQQAPPLLSQQHGMDMKGVHSAPNGVSLLATEADGQQQQSGSLGEKKRNKLGYHPTVPSPISKTPVETPNQAPASWMITAPDQSPSTSSEISAPWQTYASGSPMSTQFSPFTSVAQSPSGWPPGTSESIPQGNVDTAWGHFAPPTRSMSYGGEPLNNSHPSQYSLMAPGRQFERRPSALSDAYTTSMNGVVPGFDGSNVSTPIPFPSGAVPPTNYTSWEQTNAYTDYTYMKGNEAYGHDWSQANRGQDQGLQLANDGQQVMNNAPPMNLYQSQ
ncbi:hypothetical protein FPSE_04618 [Fusarium pseudograminearum CS3096]|uniref:Uncharacterized protein n=1 Tax=Fusarium pseudograminearum (strain CS3096) TaxID=1028729 RepID=K3VK93_FUSPC|nr:hypothetical protein FPSE_04618 [Fusarium pseudograminearum CS3096]EKJ75227.1 hypothetical protein FPSE_04618 [Fusarium pseudograminearum CS3096]